LSSFHGNHHHDTVFIETDGDQPGFLGMVVACVLMFFSFEYRRTSHSCALVHWFVHDEDVLDEDTTMWEVRLECGWRNQPLIEVISINSIICAAHLLPIYSQSHVSEQFSRARTLACDTDTGNTVCFRSRVCAGTGTV
jgi:hypothetical protein